MTVAYEIEIECETYRPRLYVSPDPRARSAPTPLVRRRRLVAVVAVAVLLVLLALPVRWLGGSTLVQAAPAQGQDYVVQPGDTLASIAGRADPAHAASLSAQLAGETGSTVVVPGEHIFIP